MRVFKSKEFARFARKSGLEDEQLCRSVFDLRRGLVDADLGGGVFKQRVGRRGEGKSGGFRTIIVLRLEHMYVYVFGYAKSDRANLTFAEVAASRTIAEMLLLSEEVIRRSLQDGKMIEVDCNGEAI